MAFLFKKSHNIMDEEEFKQLQEKPELVDHLIHQLARQRLEAWVDLAE
ncbi:MAG: hypothetical protein JXA78_07505 [Anaerolineales bacterium]|nr:hypothetical protein [Anaerolineales bacterium]